jgi:hypothetical protein
MKRALYIVYATGVAGISNVFLYFGDGVVCGADTGAGRYDGSVQ